MPVPGAGGGVSVSATARDFICRKGMDGMNSADIAARIASAHDLNRVKAREIIDDLLNTIADSVREGGEVSLPGFGKFKLSRRIAREGRNPRTGNKMSISASKKLRFSAAKALKERMNI